MLIGIYSIFEPLNNKDTTYSFIWRVKVQVYDIADAFLQHALLIIWIHKPHEIWVLEGVQQDLNNAWLVLLSSHMHHIIPAALLQSDLQEKHSEEQHSKQKNTLSSMQLNSYTWEMVHVEIFGFVNK